MGVHANSVETYKAIIDRLPKARAAVMRAIAERGPITRNEVAELLRLPIRALFVLFFGFSPPTWSCCPHEQQPGNPAWRFTL